MFSKHRKKSRRAFKEDDSRHLSRILYNFLWNKTYVLDNGAIQEALLRDPYSAKKKYYFVQLDLEVSDSYKKYPLYMAVRLGASLNTIKMLYDAFPKAMTEKYVLHKETVLQQACSINTPLDVFQFVLDENPAAIKERDILGRMPLHEACLSTISVDKLRILITRFPEALRTPDCILNYNPFEYFCECFARQFWVNNEDGNSLRDRYTNFDHAEWNAWDSMCLLLHFVHTGNVLSGNDMGSDKLMSTIYAAAAVSSPRDLQYPCYIFLYDVVQHMISKITVTQIEKNDSESTDCLFTVAIMQGVTWENGLKALFHMYPKKLFSKQTSKAALKIAIECGVVWEGLQELLKAHPEVIVSQDPMSGLFPFMIAASEKSSNLETIFLLLRSSPEVVAVGIIGKK